MEVKLQSDLGIVVKKKKKNREENSCPADKEKKRKEKKRSCGFALLTRRHRRGLRIADAMTYRLCLLGYQDEKNR
jgi:hypothetical protein